MSYTPPAYNAADLTFKSGYAAPAYNAADLSFNDGSPTVSVQTGTTISFFGKVDKIVDFSVVTNTVVYYEHPYRAFEIPTSTDATFVTWQRHFAADTSSTPVFRHGFRTNFTTGTTFDVQLWGALQAVADSETSSVSAFASSAIFNVQASSSGSTRFAAGGAFNKDIGFVVTAKSTPRFSSASDRSAAFASATNTAASLFSSALIPASFAGQAGTTPSFSARNLFQSTASVPLSSVVEWSVVPATGVVFVSGSASVFAPNGSYQTLPLPADLSEIDVIYSRQTSRQVFVTT